MTRKHSLTHEQVIQRIISIHGDKYDTSNVVFATINDKITLICPSHGEFSILPRAIFQQHQGCRKCGREKFASTRRKTVDEFIAEARAVHGDDYDYSSVISYTNNKTKVPIICEQHGVFYQTPDHHINKKQGCPLCKTGNGKGGYTHTYFQHNPEEQTKPGILYAASITNNNEVSIKIGITAKTTQQRFNRGEYKNMNIQVLQERHVTLYEAFCMEQQIIDKLQPYRFFTNTPFSGHTECFKKCDAVDAVLIDVFINMTPAQG